MDTKKRFSRHNEPLARSNGKRTIAYYDFDSSRRRSLAPSLATKALTCYRNLRRVWNETCRSKVPQKQPYSLGDVVCIQEICSAPH